MRNLFLPLTIAVACSSFTAAAEGERYLVSEEQIISWLTPLSESQTERVNRLCSNMALHGVTDEETAGLISLISPEMCREHFELTTNTIHIVLEQYFRFARKEACEDLAQNRIFGDARQRATILCETAAFEFTTDRRSDMNRETFLGVMEQLIMPALVCAAAAYEIVPEQRSGYCSFLASPADPALLELWGRLIGTAGLVPINRLGLGEPACVSYPYGDPTSPLAELFETVLDGARNIGAMVTRLEAIGLQCEAPDPVLADKEPRSDVRCREDNYLGSRWARPDGDDTTLWVISFGDHIAIDIYEDTEMGGARVCLGVFSLGI